MGLALVLVREGRFDEAAAVWRRDEAGALPGMHAGIAGILLGQHRAQAALAEIGLEGDERWRLSLLPLIYHALGRHPESDRALAGLIDKYRRFPYRIAMVYAGRGQANDAFQWLDRALLVRDFDMPWVKSEPLLQSLHQDPRFVALLTRIALPP